MTETTVPPVAFKDRRLGLIIYGVLQILFGLQSILGTILVVGVNFLSPKTAAMPMPQALWSAAFMYLFAGVALIWLGIGSILCRRWARALMLMIGWVWAAVGVLSLINMSVTFPTMLSTLKKSLGGQEIPEVALMLLLGFSVTFGIVFYLIIPGTIVFFYKSPHVKATCESRDPVPRWTDKRPLPLLTLCALLGLSALTIPLVALTYNGAIPFFGMYLSGLPGVAVSMLIALLYGFASWGCYKLRIMGWWAALLSYSLTTISCFITFVLIGVMPMYELMGMTKSQLELMRTMGVSEHFTALVNVVTVCGADHWSYHVY